MKCRQSKIFTEKIERQTHYQKQSMKLFCSPFFRKFWHITQQYILPFPFQKFFDKMVSKRDFLKVKSLYLFPIIQSNSRLYISKDIIEYISWNPGTTNFLRKKEKNSPSKTVNEAWAKTGSPAPFSALHSISDRSGFLLTGSMRNNEPPGKSSTWYLEKGIGISKKNLKYFDLTEQNYVIFF